MDNIIITCYQCFGTGVVHPFNSSIHPSDNPVCEVCSGDGICMVTHEELDLLVGMQK